MQIQRILAPLALTLLLAACRDAPMSPTPAPGPAPAHSLGLVEVTISGMGGAQMNAAASPPATAAGPLYALSAPATSGGGGNGSIQLQPLSTGSFTAGSRGSGGVRYVWASFRVRNAQADGTPYDTPRQNLTFFAASTASTLGGSPISQLRRFDGSAADPALAPQILPTGLAARDPRGRIIAAGADVLQVVTEAEAAAVVVNSGVTVLPYGFVVQNANGGGRTLPASPAADQWDGVVTFAFKIPLAASAAADPFTVSAIFVAQDDSQTRITQSLEEQNAEGEAAFLARATQIGATMKTVLPGAAAYWGEAATTRTICSVRTAGTSASPAAHLVNRAVASITLTDTLSGWKLWSTGSRARALLVDARDGDGNPVADIPVHITAGTANVAAPIRGGVRMRPRPGNAPNSTTLNVSACGVSSGSITLFASGLAPVTAMADGSAALLADLSVVEWGYRRFGVPSGLTRAWHVTGTATYTLVAATGGEPLQSNGEWAALTRPVTVPNGITLVAQITAGDNEAYALRRDGSLVRLASHAVSPWMPPTNLPELMDVSARGSHALGLGTDGKVVAWGTNTYGESTVPAGLTNVVQVAAGTYHSLALRMDGTVVAWGRNDAGQATVAGGLTRVVQVAAGPDYSLALRSDGTVVGWGNPANGAASPPAGLSNVVHISAGNSHALALRSDSTVVGWGSNSQGQLDVPAGLKATLP